ncbi:hypothetical protein PspTeo4_37888 [Pseudomonas sp. Teo4]|nr:hypothetical protein [Pseudomonas sp. Teo4]
MDVTATLSLGDPLEPARKATAEMLQTRERTYSLPQPFYTDERLFQIDMQEIFHKEVADRGACQRDPDQGQLPDPADRQEPDHRDPWRRG